MDTRLKKFRKKTVYVTWGITMTVFFVVLYMERAKGVVVASLAAVAFASFLFLFMNESLKYLVGQYQTILSFIQKLAEGDFEEITTEHLGIFEPLKEDLSKLQSSFQTALEKKVKSERMKTELITNVSHDLKTPLTAITTYVELLKKEDITEEERNSYIETLEKKSARMKILIEDLFELSKANSKDVILEFSNVDIVNLMKQVVVEHKETYEEMGLQIIWSLQEEKVEVRLDNQKTYRIFENLFLNIEKYAMRNSRVYVDVKVTDDVEIIIRNMSAEQLHVSGNHLMERFVRGDASRNTEGSGLGLAIAKSFVELQNGTFEVVVDGDLFKTVIHWKKPVFTSE